MAETPLGYDYPEDELLQEEGFAEEGSIDVDIEMTDEEREVVEASLEQMSAEEEIPFDANLAENMEDSELNLIAKDITQSIKFDLDSRKEWEKTYTKGLDTLGIKYQDERSTPFKGASSVTHPILAESVVEFQASSYKELFPAGGPVKVKEMGTKTPALTAQAGRVQDFMNYQITEVMEEYETDLDQLLFVLPIAGSAFKKTYFDELLGRPTSRFIKAEDLIVPYTATDLKSASRITHRVYMDKNELRKNQINGFYRDIVIQDSIENLANNDAKEKELELSGQTISIERDEYTLFEVHTRLDLAGYEDVDEEGNVTGLKLEYIVTIEESSDRILSIKRNWSEDDEKRDRIQYFTHFKFLPGLGFYGFGLTHMIGNLARGATSILRQLIDAGTFANMPAGFKTKGFRGKGDDKPFQPGEWRDVDSPDGKLKENIIPLPYGEPSVVLLQLLGVLVDSGQRFAAITEHKIGDANQNAPVGTTVALIEEGQKVMSGIQQRLHRAQKSELKVISRINGETLPGEYPYSVSGNNAMIKSADFDNKIDVIPVSDPNVSSMTQRVSTAQTALALVQSNPGIHGEKGTHEIYRRMYDAIGMRDIENILPPPKEPEPIDPALEATEALQGKPLRVFPGQDHDTHTKVHILTMGMPSMINPVVQLGLEAHVFEHFSMKAKETAKQDLAGRQESLESVETPAVRDAMQGDYDMELKKQTTAITADLMEKYAKMREPKEGDNPPDPQQQLVEIRKQELSLQSAELMLKQRQFESKSSFDMEGLNLNRVQGQSRDRITREANESRDRLGDKRIDVQESIADKNRAVKSSSPPKGE